MISQNALAFVKLARGTIAYAGLCRRQQKEAAKIVSSEGLGSGLECNILHRRASLEASMGQKAKSADTEGASHGHLSSGVKTGFEEPGLLPLLSRHSS